MTLKSASVIGLCVPVFACATMKGARKAPVDLGPARQAMEAARLAGASEKAPATLRQAEADLKEAEALGEADEARDKALKAEWLARFATLEARCIPSPAPARAASESDQDSPELERLNDRLRRSEEQRRRQEERNALLLRDLEVTETELIRTKARLKGIETKAEASSAIAETRILIGRLDSATQAAVLLRSREALAKAEQLLDEENYGAALFFALKAQEIARTAP